jgi:hypothetical protein
MPSLKSKMEYLQAIYARYHKAAKETKSRILEEFCKVNKYNRKYAIGLLNNPPPEERQRPRKKRSCLYGAPTIRIAEEIWKASGYLCGSRLKEAIPDWLPSARKRFPISPEVEHQLLSISSRQLDNRLREKKRQIKKRIYSTTRPGSLLKSMIPIRTHFWDVKKPGFTEMDLVAHCGNSGAGTFISTLNLTDIKTAWGGKTAVMGKSQQVVFDGILKIKNALPFRLRGVDSDNGEEFINWHLLRFCRGSRPQIQFTRGRPYKKNDNAHVEQKNWPQVRQIFGWDRYDTQEALDAMNDLYFNELCLFQNLFQPSVKLKKKIRVGSKVIRKYDTPKTPFQRVLESGTYHRAKMKKLKELKRHLDPFELSETIDRNLDRIFKMASERVGSKKEDSNLPSNAPGCNGTNGNGASHTQTPQQKAYVKNFRFSRKTRRWAKIMCRLEREAALKK